MENDQITTQEDLKQPLNPQNQGINNQEQSISCWDKFLISIGIKSAPLKARSIKFNGEVQPKIKIENIVRNQKYSTLTFVPIVLFNQFKFFQNLFFLLIAISQFFEVLKVGYIFTYVAPLVLVLVLTMMKEAYDDFKRYLRDKEANQTQYNVIKNDQFQTIKSCDIQVGDMIEVNANQRIPADLILLHTQDESGQVFIRTDQLDGETDWKLRKSIKFIQARINTTEEAVKLQKWESKIDATEPILDIYEFTGVFKDSQDGEVHTESLKLENTLWANTVLASGRIIGLVTYAGKETRMALNSRQPRSKIGRLDNEVNTLSKWLFVMMLGLSILLVVLDGQNISWFILVQLTRYLILLSSIIPISMRVNLDFAKLIYCYRINTDEDIEGTLARNSTIPEELGRIQYLLTDKTGTLTQNEMIFKRLTLENGNFNHEEINEISEKVRQQCEISNGPLSDLEQVLKKQSERKGRKKLQIKRNPDIILRDLITALTLCHNVTPMINDNGEKELQASSPDEAALVKIADSIGMSLMKREAEYMQIVNSAGHDEEYKILNLFPFSSETKRMGIVVQHIQSKKIIFYLKGADTIMKQFLPENQRGFVEEECDNLAREGLRTLVVGQRYLSESQYSEWAQKFKQADELLVGRNDAVQKVVSDLETDIEFLGITGVEDKLQDNICQSLENARNAGINIWMLTGDKLETAICISISSGLKAPQQNIYVIKEMTDELELQAKLLHFQNLASNFILIIDGISLKCAMENYKQLFLEASTKAPAVVCCRCSPTQKSQVVESIKKYTKKITAAIGDGGNDVGMITSADVGIGIVGKEGMQAALAADFSINKFCYLDKLLLWHGRLSYKRSALLSQFVIHRGLLISFIQAIFTSIYYFVALSIFNGMLLLGYATIFTMFPVFSLIFDCDVDEETAIKYPPLYKTLQKGRELNTKTFFFWVWKATFQGAIIMLLSQALFENSYLLIETITFTALIMVEYLLSLSELNRMHIVSIGSNVISFILYILILTTMRGLFQIQNIMEWVIIGKIFCIVLIAWGPLFIFKEIKKRVDPSDYEKIMRTVKINKINTNIKK